MGQAAEVVDVLVQVGDADHAAGAELGGEVVDVAGVALGEGLVVGEVVGYALGELGVAELLGQGLGEAFDVGAELVGGVVDLVDDDAAKGEFRLDQFAVEVDGLVDRLALGAADDEEAGLGSASSLLTRLARAWKPSTMPLKALKNSARSAIRSKPTIRFKTLSAPRRRGR